MTLSLTATPTDLHLRVFGPHHAVAIAGWVRTERELRWLAPSTPLPLTPEKVMGWLKPGGRALVLMRERDAEPVAYGELNPMRREPDRLWIGHAIVRPDERGQGVGRTFMRALVDHAFHQLFASRVALIVFPDNMAAVECYRSVGFRIVGEEYHRFGGTGPKHRLVRFEMHAPDGDRPTA